MIVKIVKIYLALSLVLWALWGHFQGSSLCLTSSVCCSLQCLISALTCGAGAVVDTCFLGSLVQLCCGEGGMLQTNNTGVCLQCLSHTGPDPAHGACSLPAHIAQALGCSTGTAQGRPWAAWTSQV